MKRVFSILMLFALTAVTSCSDDDKTIPTPEPEVKPEVSKPADETVSFEQLTMADGSAVEFETLETSVWGTPYTYTDILTGKQFATTVKVENYYTGDEVDSQVYNDKLVTYTGESTTLSVGAYYSDGMEWGYAADNFGGFILTKNSTTTPTSSYGEQFSALATGGANNSDTFLVAYDSSWSGVEYSLPTLTLSEPRKLKSISFANSPLTVDYKPYVGDKVKVYLAIDGYKGDDHVAYSEVTLINDEGVPAFDGWSETHFDWFNTVDKITFRVKSADASAPLYFCIDEVTFAGLAD